MEFLAAVGLKKSWYLLMDSGQWTVKLRRRRRLSSTRPGRTGLGDNKIVIIPAGFGGAGKVWFAGIRTTRQTPNYIADFSGKWVASDRLLG